MFVDAAGGCRPHGRDYGDRNDARVLSGIAAAVQSVSGVGPRILIAGGGFGGLYAALYLARSPDRPPGTRIVLLDRKNFFTFTPLLAEVASGSLGREHVTQPYRVYTAKHEFEFLQADIHVIEPQRKRLVTSIGQLSYDYLVLALGGEPRYFGMEEVERTALPYQSLRHALALRDRGVGLVEQFQHTSDKTRREAMMSFVIAGGGPAGSEVAGELQHLLCDVVPRYYDLDVVPRIVLVEGGEEILGQFDPRLAREGHRLLEERGVEIFVGVRVAGYESGSVVLSDGERIRADTLVWTVGVGPSRVVTRSDLPRANGGGVEVDEFLRVVGCPNIYAVGDCNHIVSNRLSATAAAGPIQKSRRSPSIRGCGRRATSRTTSSGAPSNATRRTTLARSSHWGPGKRWSRLSATAGPDGPPGGCTAWSIS